jgi:PAS domain S-box-containing protein
MLDPVVTIDPAGIIQEASQSVLGIFGYAPEELVGQNVKVLMPEPHRENHDAYLARYARTGETGILNRTREFEVVRKDGTRLVCELSVSRVDPPGEARPLFIGSFRDVTARRRAEAELRESERRFRAIFDQEFQFVGLLSTDGRLLEANQAALDAVGVARTEAIGRPFWETAWWAHDPRAQEVVRQAVADAARGKFVRFETSHRRPSGDLLAVDFSLKPILDGEGRVALLLPEGRDITQLKEAQRRETNMLRALATIGESASILAHEIKNPITAINVALKAVAQSLGEDHQAVLADLVGRLQRVERTMRRTLSFARPLELRRRPLAPEDVLGQAARGMRAELERAGVELVIQVDRELPALDADPQLLEEVLVNLLRNAREALGAGGRVRLSAAAVRGGVLLAVEDDGPGIPESALLELFKPFHTTKAEGTGIGLALCKKIVEEHGGEISAGRSALGGARFALRLPAGAGRAPAPPAAGLRTGA